MVADQLGTFFGIHDGEISTWNVDAFIAAVKRVQGDETEAIRRRELLRQYPYSKIMS